MALTDSALVLYNTTSTLVSFISEAKLTKGMLTTVAGDTYIIDPTLTDSNVASVSSALAQVKIDLGI